MYNFWWKCFLSLWAGILLLLLFFICLFIVSNISWIFSIRNIFRSNIVCFLCISFFHCIFNTLDTLSHLHCILLVMFLSIVPVHLPRFFIFRISLICFIFIAWLLFSSLEQFYFFLHFFSLLSWLSLNYLFISLLRTTIIFIKLVFKSLSCYSTVLKYSDLPHYNNWTLGVTYCLGFYFWYRCEYWCVCCTFVCICNLCIMYASRTWICMCISSREIFVVCIGAWLCLFLCVYMGFMSVYMCDVCLCSMYVYMYLFILVQFFIWKVK